MENNNYVNCTIIMHDQQQQPLDLNQPSFDKQLNQWLQQHSLAFSTWSTFQLPLREEVEGQIEEDEEEEEEEESPMQGITSNSILETTNIEPQHIYKLEYDGRMRPEWIDRVVAMIEGKFTVLVCMQEEDYIIEEVLLQVRMKEVVGIAKCLEWELITEKLQQQHHIYLIKLMKRVQRRVDCKQCCKLLKEGLKKAVYICDCYSCFHNNHNKKFNNNQLNFNFEDKVDSKGEGVKDFNLSLDSDQEQD